MATESVQELMFRLRVADDEINQQFVQVSETLKQNLDRINRQRNLIDIQARIELAGLDKATDATQIFQVRQRQLQNQIDAAKAKMQLLNTVYREAAQRTGEASEETQRAQIRYEQARLAVARLERQMRQLNETQERAGESTTNWLNKLANVGGAIRNLEELQKVISAIEGGIVRFNDRFKELEKISYDFSLPFDQAREFADKVKLAGGELQDIGGFLRGVTDAIVKGEKDDYEWIALEKYGVEIMDATGRLKNYADIMESINEGYLKAKAEGSEIEYLQMLGGESGVTDAAQIMERWGEATEDAAKTVKAALDPAELRESERAINLLTIQITEFADALSQFLSPATKATAESFFEIFRDATGWLTENKDLIKETAWEVARFFGAVPDIDFSTADKSLLKTADSADKLKSSLQGLTKGSDNNPLSQYGITRTNQYRDEIEDLRLEIDYVDKFQRKLAELNLWRERALDQIYLSSDEENSIDELFWTKLEQIEQEKDERIADIWENAERARRTDLENTLADIEREKQKRIQAGMEAAEAIKLAADESAAAIKNLEDAFTDKVNRFKNNALQNKFSEIENERDSWIKQGIDPERATAFAEEQRYQALTELEESFSQRINEIRGNDLENQLARIEQEKQAWIDKGIEESRAEELAAAQKIKILTDYADKQQQDLDRYAEQEQQRQKQIAEAIEDYWKRVADSIERQFDEALSVLKSQLDAFRAYRDKGLKGLEEYERKQLKKQGITDKDLQSMTKDNLDDFKQAQKDVKRRLLPNFQPVNDVPVPELPPPIKLPKAFDDLTGQVYRTTDALSNFAETADGKRYTLDDLYNERNYAEDANGNRYYLDDLYNNPNLSYPPQPETPDLSADLNQSTVDALSGLGDTFTSAFTSANEELSQITQALSVLISNVRNTGGTSGSQSQPANVNVTVQIEEAHAWDSQHIQELSDRVADNIQPAIINAIGGDSNGY